MSDLEPEEDEQTDLVEDDSEDHQRASEKARTAREKARDAEREDGQLDLDTAAQTRRLDEFDDGDREGEEAGE